MIDFGVLSAVRNALSEQNSGDAMQLPAANIYLTALPPAPDTWPLVLIELEELWGNRSTLANYNARARLLIKISIFSNTPSGGDSLEVANHVSWRLNGQSLLLADENAAMCKLQSSVLDLKKKADEPRKAVQYYEIWVHSQKASQPSDHSSR